MIPVGTVAANTQIGNEVNVDDWIQACATEVYWRAMRWETLEERRIFLAAELKACLSKGNAQLRREAVKLATQWVERYPNGV